MFIWKYKSITMIIKNDYTKIKIQEQPGVGFSGKSIAELTKFGWVIVSHGKATRVTDMLFPKTSFYDN